MAESCRNQSCPDIQRSEQTLDEFLMGDNSIFSILPDSSYTPQYPEHPDPVGPPGVPFDET